MLYRLIMCIAVIRLMQEAVAANIDTAYLRVRLFRHFRHLAASASSVGYRQITELVSRDLCGKDPTVQVTQS